MASSSVGEKVAGRLAFFVNIWSTITGDSMILEAIAGYKIPFRGNPPSRPHLSEPRLSKSDRISCASEIERLLAKGAIRQAQWAQDHFLSSYFLIDKPSGGKRFILDLKPLNRFVSTPHFKMEGIDTVCKLLSPGCFMASLDLEDAYLLVPIHESHRKYLRFVFQGKLYEFIALPFGLSTAPFIFTKILKPVAALLRGKGFLSVIYLDDFLLIGDSVEECTSNVRKTLQILRSLGFIINRGKSDLIPQQIKRFLGFIFNSRDMSITLPEEKRLINLQRIKDFSKIKSCKIRQFASLIGSLISICRAIPYGLLYTRDFEREKFRACCKYGDDFDRTMRLPSSLQPDFSWWINTLSHLPCSGPLIRPSFSVEIYTDASLTGWGASMGNQTTHGWWSEEERMEHINFLELKAVEYALKCFVNNESSKDILLRIDNTTAIAYINKMGSVQFQKLASIAKVIWQWCEARAIYLFASYISSEDNYIADSESRIISTETEWELNASAFDKILRQLGPFDIDLFATYANTKCDSFCSWLPDPFSVAVDAFTVDWSLIYFYAFPPFSIITKTLSKIIRDKAEGALIVPWWPTQPWFPLFKKLCVTDPIIFDPSPNLLTSPFRKQHPVWFNISLAAGKLSAKRFAARDFLNDP